jgi:hypothetical protein
MAVAQVALDAFQRWQLPAVRHTEHLRDRRCNQAWVGNRRQPDERHTVRVVVARCVGRLHGQPRLACPSRASEGEQPATGAGSAETTVQVLQQLLAPDKARGCRR